MNVVFSHVCVCLRGCLTVYSSEKVVARKPCVLSYGVEANSERVDVTDDMVASCVAVRVEFETLSLFVTVDRLGVPLCRTKTAELTRPHVPACTGQPRVRFVYPGNFHPSQLCSQSIVYTILQGYHYPRLIR